MIAAITVLLFCQLLGEILVRALSLPLPGPVAGFGLMFGVLVWRGRRGDEAVAGVVRTDAIPDELGRVSDALLQNLSLLFIPAAVGMVQYLGLLRAEAAPIAVAIVASTLATLVVTVATFRFVSRLHAFRRRPIAEDIEAAAGFDRPDEPR